jgi:hypothetical protein
MLAVRELHVDPEIEDLSLDSLIEHYPRRA